MKLLTEDLKKRLPALYANEDKGMQAKALIHFFAPGSAWDWYASEGSSVDENGFYDTDKPKADFLFFGLVCGHEMELGYFSLSELERVRIPVKLHIQPDNEFITVHYKIERNLYWTPKTLQEIWDERKRRESGA